MSKNLVIGLVLIVLLVLGFAMFSKNRQTSLAPVSEIGQTQMEDELATNLLEVALTEQNESGETGAATLLEENGKVTVTLAMAGGPGATSQPAHIHVGSCPDVGAVKYPLTNVVNGESTTTLEVTLAQLESELPLGINVHKSAAEAGVYVSCGNLVF